MTLLNTLQNKDLMQELFDNPLVTNQKIDKVHLTSSSDVVLKGLIFLIPLMNQEMLKVRPPSPSLHLTHSIQENILILVSNIVSRIFQVNFNNI